MKVLVHLSTNVDLVSDVILTQGIEHQVVVAIFQMFAELPFRYIFSTKADYSSTSIDK